MPELYISVDVEAAGPIPAKYSLLSIGAAVVGDRTKSFYRELKPINTNFVQEALEVIGRDLSYFEKNGLLPEVAFRELAEWLKAVGNSKSPVFVGFNAGFDWSFVNWYFHEYFGSNPFGFAPLDIKAFYMGLTGCKWADTRSSKLPDEFKHYLTNSHNALVDAREQGELFEHLLRIKGETPDYGAV